MIRGDKMVELTNVGEQVDQSYENQRNRDGTWKILDWIFKFFNDEVQVIPSIVSKQPGIKWQSQRLNWVCCVFKCKILSVS